LLYSESVMTDTNAAAAYRTYHAACLAAEETEAYALATDDADAWARHDTAVARVLVAYRAWSAAADAAR